MLVGEKGPPVVRKNAYILVPIYSSNYSCNYAHLVICYASQNHNRGLHLFLKCEHTCILLYIWYANCSNTSSYELRSFHLFFFLNGTKYRQYLIIPPSYKESIVLAKRHWLSSGNKSLTMWPFTRQLTFSRHHVHRFNVSPP